MTKKSFVRIACVGFFTGVIFLSGCSTNSASFPDFSAPVVDATGAVNDDIEKALSVELENFRTAFGPQIAVAVINTTGTASTADYAFDLANKWSVGDAERDDGVLILIALEDRELRIDVGSGVEGDLTDVAAGRIVDEVMLPLLRANDVNGAVTQGAGAVMAVWQGQDLPGVSITDPVVPVGGNTSDWIGIFFFLLFVGGSILMAIFGRLNQNTTVTSGGSRGGIGPIFLPGGFNNKGRGFGDENLGKGFDNGFGGGFNNDGAGKG